MKNSISFAFFLSISLLFCASPAAQAASFNITTSTTSRQTLNSGETGQITSTGTLSVSSGSNPALTLGTSGSQIVFTNSGVLLQTGGDRGIRDNNGGLDVVIVNSTNSLMQTSNGDVIQMNKGNSSIVFNNYGTLTSLNSSAGGNQAIDFAAVTLSSNVLQNFASGIIQATDADAVRPGVSGVITNAGIIRSYAPAGGSTDGIDAQNNSGVIIANTGTVEGGRHAITGGAIDNSVTFTMTISNGSGGTIQGNNGAGVNIDGFNANETVRITNSGTITGNGVTGDGDGVDVDGVVILNNSGTIKSFNSTNTTGSAFSEGVTVGGGTIVNTGTITGTISSGNTNPQAIGRGITLGGVDTTGTPEPIYADSVITNSGRIQGYKDSGITVLGAASGHTVTIVNQAAGTIQGGSSTNAAVQTGADNDTLVNSGTIIGDSGAKAVDLGGGTNTMTISGGAASITGDISGGTGTSSLTIDPGAGNHFSYAGAISSFSSVVVKSGAVTLSGANTYTGTTTVSSSTLHLSGSTASSSTTVTGSGNLHLVNGTAGGVIVGNGGTLSGNGTVGALTLNAGGVLSPGNSPGTITAGNTVVNPGASMIFQVNTDGSTGTAGANWDHLLINGTLDLTNLDSSNTFTITLQSLNGADVIGDLVGGFDVNQDHTWDDFISFSGGLVGGTFSSSLFSIDASQFESGTTSTTSGTFKVVQHGANNLSLQYNTVPEPSTWAMLVAGGLGLLLAARRKRLA